jgi:hypothetical protein
MAVRKTLIVLMAIVLAAAAITSPALAAKKKKKKGSFAAEGVPFPGPTAGCNGAPDFSQTLEPFKAPSNGILVVTMVEFDGDWDLFVNYDDGSMIGSATESQLQGAPAQEEVVVGLRKGQEVLMGPCNWIGGPSATVNWEFTYTK